MLRVAPRCHCPSHPSFPVFSVCQILRPSFFLNPFMLPLVPFPLPFSHQVSHMVLTTVRGQR